MSYITWSDDLAVGNTFIDNDHKKLIEMVDRLHVVMQDGKGREVMDKVLHNLIKYTQEHFRREEDLMHNMRYPGIIEHKEEHDKLVKQVIDLQHKFESGVATMSIEVLHFLRDWLVNHIAKSDQDLAIAASGRQH